MPAKAKSDTLPRLLELLQAIPHRRFASPEELTKALNSRGYAVHVRTVQRDLQMLREHLPLEVRDDSKPHGWGWKNQAPDGIAGIGTGEALMVALVERHLKAALPASMLDSFVPTFERARRRLAKLGPRSGQASWATKVAEAPVALAGMAPKTSIAVREAVSTALLQERQLDCQYLARAHGSVRSYRLHPLGVVLRGNAVYLVATKGLGTLPSFYALHRIQSADVRVETATHEDGMTLEAALRRSKSQFGAPTGSESTIQLHLTCDKVIAGYLEESPLAEDQVLVAQPDSSYEVRATLVNSWELRWWLLSRAAHVAVLAPKALRREIASTLRQGLARYIDD